MTSTAFLDDFYTIVLESEFIPDQILRNSEFLLISNQLQIQLSLTKIEHFDRHSFYTLKSAQPLEIHHPYHLNMSGTLIPVMIGKITRTADFDNKFNAADEMLGANVIDGKTIFKVWSPVANTVNLILDDTTYHMQRRDNGTFTYEINADCHLKTYYYEAFINHHFEKIVDPYTKSLTLNSEKGVVINFDCFSNEDNLYARPKYRQKEAIIYEVHTRDFSMHPYSGISEHYKGKLPGLIEEGTTTPEGFSTGFDYLKELGVTHIELLPINDFARVDDIEFKKTYNWGYDPENFMSIDGSYSQDPGNPALRIQELKSVVSHMHKNNIGVILDVVFNHVYNKKTSSFEKLVPGYYFRYFSDNRLSNGTGVGNDTRTESVMMRKFFVETVAYYMNEFKVDGFRFDLMGAIDIETMREIEALIMKDNPYAMILGEGWNLDTALEDHMKTTPDNAWRVPYTHFFNDYFRDTLKGNNFNLKDTGYFNGLGKFYDRMFHLFIGTYSPVPIQQTINYSEVHDNHTLYDRLKFMPDTTAEEKMRIHMMITLFTVLSPGTPFIHAGQEFFRTKFGHGNTYNLSDLINQIDWMRRGYFNQSVEFFKQAVAVKRKYNVFNLEHYEEIERVIFNVPVNPPILYIILFDKKFEFHLMFNPSQLVHEIKVPRKGIFKIILSNTGEENDINGYYLLKPYECILFMKKL